MATLDDLQRLEYTRKPVTRLSPDAFVLVNGEGLLQTCSRCDQKVSIDDVMSISVNLGVEASPGSASVSIAAPAHSSKNYFRFGKLAFSPMQEIEIFAKGRFFVGQEREIRYYPIFWGFITSASYEYGGGTHTITLDCRDILYWWTLSPLTTRPGADTTQVDTSFSNMLNKGIQGKNPFEILYMLNKLA